MYRKLFIFILILLFTYVSVLPISGRERQKLGILTGYVSGKLLFTEIPLWNKPGGLKTGGTIKYKVKSGTPVEIVHELRVDNQIWYKINTYGVKKGMSGWVPSFVVRFP
jgi:hypothetical protein